MALDLYSLSRTVDFGGPATSPSTATFGNEEFIGDAYDGILYVKLENASDGLSGLSLRVSATSNFTASSADKAKVDAITLDCDATPTVSDDSISTGTGASAYVFYVSKLAPYVQLYASGDCGKNGQMHAVLVATNLSEAPAQYSDNTANNY